MRIVPPLVLATAAAVLGWGFLRFSDDPAATSASPLRPSASPGISESAHLDRENPNHQTAARASRARERQGRRVAHRDPQRARREFRALSTTRERTFFLRGLFSSFGPRRQKDAIRCALAFHGRDRNLAFRTLIATKWPEISRHWPPGISRANGMGQLILEHFSGDPDFAVTNARRLLPREKVDALLLPIVARSARMDAPTAARILSEMTGANNRRPAVSGLAEQWAQQDTAAALRWADTLVADERSVALTAIQKTAPVGVGMMLRNDSSSPYPLVSASLAGSPADRSGAVGPGDRILAVRSGGDWAQTEGQPLESVIGLLRGTAGHPAEIRILPAGASDPSQARTVVLTREQLLFRRPSPAPLRR